MNIFFLNSNPRKAAEHHCDKHVVKMIIETAQLLYSAHWMVNPEGLPPDAYKKTHVNHPSAMWVRESVDNYKWLCDLGVALCEEYTFRYGKIHKTHAHILWLARNPLLLPTVGITKIRLAMPVEYKLANPILSYQKYYRENKLMLRGIVKYTKRSMPDFLLVDGYTVPVSKSSRYSTE